MTTTSSDTARDAVHAAARRVFARTSVGRATLAEIATEAQIPLDDLRAQYATEDDLLRDIIAAWAAQEAVAAPPLAPERPFAGLLTDTPPPRPAAVTGNRRMEAQLPTLSTPPKTRRGGRIPLSEIVASALGSLGANKMRSALTMLGIIIGVTAVVGLLAIGNGVSGSIQKQLESNGSNLVTIQGSSATTNGVATGQRYASITLEDAQEFAQSANIRSAGAVAFSPEVQRSGQITAGSANAFATFIGVWPEYTTVRNSTVGKGDFITDNDVSGNSSVVVLGPSLAETLFGTDDPIGQSVQITGKAFRVVGVMTSKSGGFNSPDSQAYVPITTALAQLGGEKAGISTIKRGRLVDSINIKAQNQAAVSPVVNQVTDTLNVRHGITGGQQVDYEVTTQEQLLQTVQSTLLLIRIFLVVVAGISLLVGGIGIMNIMLVSVTERTREIGIRKAIGAQEGTILTQFVVESTLISLIGAVIGVILGVLIAKLVSAVWQESTVSFASVAVAVGVAVVTGIFFGVYPARRAAHLKPIDALRFE